MQVLGEEEFKYDIQQESSDKKQDKKKKKEEQLEMTNGNESYIFELEEAEIAEVSDGSVS